MICNYVAFYFPPKLKVILFILNKYFWWILNLKYTKGRMLYFNTRAYALL